MWFLVLVLLVAAAFVAYKMRVPLLAKVLGQSEGRVNRRLDRRKD
ncbi:hypothetical protein [Nocardioides sp.]|nr:hypothetical protein [Nocardioides sp.]